MEFDCELNFTDICRCCKRTSIGMTSIFDGIVHPTYPPVKDMLRTIAALNVREDDGLPSLVCTSCIDNIQDAYTFIVHLILVDKELWQVLLTRGKPTNTLYQETYDLNQYKSTDSAERENESEPIHTGANSLDIHINDSDDVKHSLKVEEVDEPMQNDYHHGSADNCYENLNFVVKVEDLAVCENEEGNALLLRREQSKSVNSEQSLTEITREDIQLNHQKHYSELYQEIGEPVNQWIGSNFDGHTPFEAKESTQQEFRYPDNQLIYTVNIANDDNLLKIEKPEDMEEFEDEDNMVADNYYQEDNEEGCYNVDSTENEFNPDAMDNEEISSSKLAPTLVLTCNVCGYANVHMDKIRQHLLSHFKDKPFACPKCHGTFTQKGTLQNHLRKCNGEINKYARHKGKASKQVISMTLQDLKDPEKMKKYLTVRKIDVQRKADDDLNMQRAEDRGDDVESEENCRRNASSVFTVFKCKLCAYTAVKMNALKRHLETHCKEKPFTCSKCSRAWKSKRNMLGHLPTCNGESPSRYMTYTSKRVKPLTSEELKDPMKMKKYYTMTKIDMQSKELKTGEQTDNESYKINL